ncbi:hypothetical protein ZIOFF_073395 [Zingiber officinale]|uniref:Uncharacterized protein n=1 Tax=Zingiber officinale TaxID=94328 RepID=A0A8J5ETR0_ZINOF|nr:hypothetical protein ZIOFF_073395 [Zingiber officinale]
MSSGGQSSRLIDELCAMLAPLLHAPRLTVPPVDVPTRPRTPRRFPPVRISPTGFALRLLGASLALMICGSFIFFIGFLLMPWILGLVFVFYFAGILSYLPGIGKVILFPKRDSSSPKEMSEDGLGFIPLTSESHLVLNESLLNDEFGQGLIIGYNLQEDKDNFN